MARSGGAARPLPSRPGASRRVWPRPRPLCRGRRLAWRGRRQRPFAAAPTAIPMARGRPSVARGHRAPPAGARPRGSAMSKGGDQRSPRHHLGRRGCAVHGRPSRVGCLGRATSFMARWSARRSEPAMPSWPEPRRGGAATTRARRSAHKEQEQLRISQCAVGRRGAANAGVGWPESVGPCAHRLPPQPAPPHANLKLSTEAEEGPSQGGGPGGAGGATPYGSGIARRRGATGGEQRSAINHSGDYLCPRRGRPRHGAPSSRPPRGAPGVASRVGGTPRKPAAGMPRCGAPTIRRAPPRAVSRRVAHDSRLPLEVCNVPKPVLPIIRRGRRACKPNNFRKRIP